MTAGAKYGAGGSDVDPLFGIPPAPTGERRRGVVGGGDEGAAESEAVGAGVGQAELQDEALLAGAGC